ncbi:hypothetical protein ACHQM5_008117 [Ranunculus cassubicifolius]
MSGSSPSHSGGAGGSSSTAIASDENSLYKFPTDLISADDRKDEALRVLKKELMDALQKEVKSLDEDSWKFAGPRSQIHLLSRPGEWYLGRYYKNIG